VTVATYNMAALLKARAQEHPDRDALIFGTGHRAGQPTWSHCTFAELDRRSDRFAAGLRAQGLGRGDRLVFLMKPSADLYALLFGAIKLGALPILMDPGMGLRKVLECVTEIAPKALIATPLVHAIATVMRAPFATASVRITDGRRWFWRGLTVADALGPDVPFALEPFAATDEVGIVFTSGSTGTPKGVTYTHGTFHAVATLADERIGRHAGATYLECFAAYVLFDVAQGMTTVVPHIDLSKPAKADPRRVAEAISTWSCTGGFVSPAILRTLLRHCRSTGTELPGFHNVLTGVAPIPAALHRGLRAINPDARLHVVYGATEGMTIAHICSNEVLGDTWLKTVRGAGNCVGELFPDVELRVLAITDDPIPTWADAVEVADGEIGEITVAGPVVSTEYKGRPDANAQAKIADGDRTWHRTGDLGYRDERGRLWYCGRKAHRVQTATGMLPTVPLEGIFNEHPGVHRTALVGVGVPGAEVATLLLELDASIPWNDDDVSTLLAYADGTPWAGRVQRVLTHPGFPVDPRHNAKIRRELLKPWATRRAAAANPQLSGPKSETAP